MRLALVLTLLLATPAFAHDDAAKHSETPFVTNPVQTTADGVVYGAALEDSVPAVVSLDDVIANPEALIGKPGAFSGRITEVCQKMGCWIVLGTSNGDFVRVTMLDHAFGVPKDAASGEAVVYGTLAEKILTADEIEHLKNDGANAPTERELRIEATSVLIRNAG